MDWFKKLQSRWKVSARQAVWILIVFACTGTTVLLIKKPLLSLLFGSEDLSGLHTVLYLIFILPLYNLLLLLYGALFGQFSFFWEFEKRFFKKLFRR